MLTKPTPNNNTLLIALGWAVVVHIGFILIKLGDIGLVTDPQLDPITLRLQTSIEPYVEPSFEEEEVSSEKLKVPVKQVETSSLAIDAEEHSIAIEAEPKTQQATTATIINSSEYKQWIQSETTNHIENNPNALIEFADSFILPIEETPADIESEVSPLGTGLTDIRRNGKVTCQLQIMLPFTNSFSSSSFKTFKDCTPEKKFELNIK